MADVLTITIAVGTTATVLFIQGSPTLLLRGLPVVLTACARNRAGEDLAIHILERKFRESDQRGQRGETLHSNAGDVILC